MKVIHKFFVIALLLSLIFSISAISAADNLENMTFEQSNMEDVSIETLNVPSEDTQEINSVEDESSVSDAEDEILKASNEDELSATSTFSQIQTKINNANAGSTIYLNGDTYNYDKGITVTKSLTIVGGSTLNDGKYATLNGLNKDDSYSSFLCKGVKVTLINIKFINSMSPLHIEEAHNSIVQNCVFDNNKNSYSGSAMWITDSNNVQIINSVFNKNTVTKDNGFIIYFNKGTGLKIQNSNFTNNDGGVLVAYDGKTTISKCLFSNNKHYSTYSSGVVTIKDGDVLDSTFSNNAIIKNATHMTGDGGALCLSGSNTVKGCKFISNSASRKGGAIYSYTPLNVNNTSLFVENCDFISNSAFTGSAIYTSDSFLKLSNNNFTNNPSSDGSGSVSINSKDYVITGNKFNNDPGVFIKDLKYDGLNIVVLNNLTLKAFEGTVKLYAKILTNDGMLYSSNDFTFLVGNKKLKTKLVKNVAEVDYTASLKDNGTIVSVDIPNANIKTGKLEIVKYAVLIDFEDAVGFKGTSLTIPVHVYDTLGYGLNGTIRVMYNGNEKDVKLNSVGKANVLISLPAEEITFDLIISYNDEFTTTHKVTVYDPNNMPVDEDSVVIELPENEYGYIGKTVKVPVYVYHKISETPLNGDIVYSYNGAQNTITLQNGRAEIILNLPNTPSVSNLTVYYQNIKKSSIIDVYDPNTHVNIDLDENIVGEVSKILSIPIFVHDNNNNPLTGEITITYNGHQKVETLVDGRINVVMGLPINPTTFDLAVIYHGVVKESKITVKDPVRPHDPNATVIIILPENESGHVGKTVIVPVNIYDSEGNYMEGEILALYNGHEVTETLYNGGANIIINLPENPITFDLTIKYRNSSAVCKITVKKQDNNTLDDNQVVIELENDITGHIGKSIQIPVYIHDGNGNPLVGQFRAYYNAHENSHNLVEGRANVFIGLPVNPTTFEFSVLYEGIIKTVNIIVVDPKNPMGDINETQTNDNGSVVIGFPKDAQGNVTVNINGKNYTGKVVNGQVVLDLNDLPSGSYYSTVYYSGDGNYSKSTKTMVIIVKEINKNNPKNPVKPPAVKKASKITAKKKTFKATKKVKKYTITLKSGKLPIKKVQLTIKIGKKTYKAKTNAKGKATFKIKKLTKKGKYNAVIKFKGDKTYKATSKKVKITIK